MVKASLTRQQARDALAVAFYRHFARQNYQSATGVTPVWAPYMDIICNEVQAALEKRHDLTIWLPPGMSKTVLGNWMIPAWWWLRHPADRFLSAAQSLRLSSRDSRESRRFLQTEGVQRLAKAHGHDLTLSRAQAEKMDYLTRAGGGRLAVSPDAGVTGNRAHVQIWDDLIDANKAMVGTGAQLVERLDLVWTKARGWSTRFYLQQGQKRGPIIQIGQRLAQGDPGDRLAQRGARVVCLPMEYDPDHPHAHELDRRKPGELLCPQIFSMADRDQMVRDIGERWYQAQYQQQPTAREGGLVKREWFERATYLDDPHKHAGSRKFITVDCAAKTGKSNDWTVMMLWVRSGPKLVLLAERRGRWDIIEQRRQLEALYRSHRNVGSVLIEDASNGTALIQDMRSKLSGVVGISPHGRSKEGRGHRFCIMAEAGDIIIPDPTLHPWVSDVLDEWCAVGAGGAHDDRFDCAAMAAERVAGRPNSAGLSKALARRGW